ncbi:CoA pyrophosphatase [Rhizobium sp. L1K21]|uniref:CoA pyrophosphatase n=1 Tax=Rhizobium sp. L1K21 TaxID=2954933 RepID=UPI002093931A|nr:CoA pyrophosphatase [Rhizobium sp. L1K21]MCO6185431.1 CoA pyrophosphatase [Rhizobium sp. L1K21]
MTRERFSIEEFKRRALKQVGEPDHLDWEDHADVLLNPGLAETLTQVHLRDAAVLIPVIDDDGDPRVIFTRRTSNLRKHSGQVAFPGGAVDAGDVSVESAALREAEEEIGLAPEYVDVIARLPDYSTMTGFKIAPVIASVRPGFVIEPNPDEVDYVFEVPLAFLMNEGNHRLESRVWEGRERYYYSMTYGEHYIWGVTAGILRTLYERLYGW